MSADCRARAPDLFSAANPRRQVVFSAAEPHLDVAVICEQVARALASETRSSVALLERPQEIKEVTESSPHRDGSIPIKSRSTRITANLWRVAQHGLGDSSQEPGTVLHWRSCLRELGSEFEYAVIPGPPALASSEAALLGQITDGIILVLGAQSTRRATARKIKGDMEAARACILGIVLSERIFPIPEQIYRRL